MIEKEGIAEIIEPSKISEIFSVIPKYDGGPIFVNTFICSCATA